MVKTDQAAAGTGSAQDPIVEFFNRRAQDYHREYHEETPGGYALRIRQKKVMDLFDQPGGSVLDVRCGPGVLTQEILNRVSVTNLQSPYAWWKNYVFYPAVATWHSLRARMGSQNLKAGRSRSAKTRALFSRRRSHNMLQSEGAQVLETAGYYYNLFISALDELMPRSALAVTRGLEEGRWPKPDWAAAGFILKARKL